MKQRNWRLYAFLVLSVIAVLVTAVLSVFLGSTDISWQTVLQALFAPDMSSHQQIAVVDLRLPRTLGDILVGAGLAVSGAIMQGVTRNPLADSGLLGINAGASFALALCLAFLTHVSFGFTILASFAGAAVSMLAVFGILLLRHRNLDSARLVLAGLAVSLFLTALTQGIAILTSTGQSLTFWTAGGVAGIRMEQLRVAAPVMILALAGSVLLSSKLSILSLGDEAAQGLTGSQPHEIGSPDPGPAPVGIRRGPGGTGILCRAARAPCGAACRGQHLPGHHSGLHDRRECVHACGGPCVQNRECAGGDTSRAHFCGHWCAGVHCHQPPGDPT